MTIRGRAVTTLVSKSDACYIHRDRLTENAYMDGYLEGATHYTDKAIAWILAKYGNDMVNEFKDFVK